MTDMPPAAPAQVPDPSRRQRLLRAESASLPAEGTDYVRFLRGPRSRWWRGALSIVLALVAFLVVGYLVALPVGIVSALIGGVKEEWFPVVVMLVGLAGIAAVLPTLLLVQRWVFRVRGRWLHSVEGRFRWGLALKAAAVSVVPLAGATVLSSVWEGTPVAPDWSTAAIVGLVGALVLVPFQAAAEEYLVRGVVARAAGSWLRAPWAGLVVSVMMSSLFFALLHGSLLPGMLIYYTLFGALLWALAWGTGGLEAAAAVHAVYNLIGFVQAFLFGQPVATATTATAADQFSSFWLLAPLAVVTALIVWWFRRSGVRRTYAGVEGDVVRPDARSV